MIEPYRKLAGYYYDELGNYSLQYLQLIDYVASHHGFSPDSILDIACGTGNLLSALHNMNKYVVGCDASPYMLAVARKRNPDIEFHQCSMTEIALGHSFDLAVCSFDSINYLLDETDISRLFSAVEAHLINGGFFLFDVITPHKFREHHGTVENKEIEDTKLTITRTYDEGSELGYTIINFDTGDIERHVQKAYHDETIAGLLEQNGLKILDTFANIDFAAPASDAKRLIYVVRKEQVS